MVEHGIYPPLIQDRKKGTLYKINYFLENLITYSNFFLFQ